MSTLFTPSRPVHDIQPPTPHPPASLVVRPSLYRSARVMRYGLQYYGPQFRPPSLCVLLLLLPVNTVQSGRRVALAVPALTVSCWSRYIVYCDLMFLTRYWNVSNLCISRLLVDDKFVVPCNHRSIDAFKTCYRPAVHNKYLVWLLDVTYGVID